ncbi:hypothetical protein tinsulaeT_13540 [Thalassotalea insulae]|uniref:Signal transduction histidine kinase internal region domain-containing protein n=1 Tax=Thalassotalea insulae TaxID=2056778 RepID=A0ABQ6GQV6_9GAMM|nr:histidine kinase [Thalassotalea insulae]GLX78014.1 hypothetical protein tinsulaeT_13540 [Thalassotalea insulae]
MVRYFKELINNLPNWHFWFANTLFWLVLNTLAASNTYRVRTEVYAKSADFIELWFKYLPFWGNWILVAPFIIASTATIKLENNDFKGFVTKNIATTVLFLGIYWLLTIIEVHVKKHSLLDWQGWVASFNDVAYSLLHIDFLVYLSIFGVGYAMSYYKNAKQQELTNQQLAKQLVEIELHSLRSQLNPHFLFNTLNTISSLIRLDEKNTAVKALSELSTMLRKVLENQQTQLIPLEEELEFINSYLSIQKMRFEDKLSLEINVSDHCLKNQIPFMLLQPLVENAVQHGSQLESDHNKIELHINCDDSHILIRLVNKFTGKDEHKGFGIGITNTKERLKKLYGDKAKLELKALEHEYFETSVSLPKE